MPDNLSSASQNFVSTKDYTGYIMLSKTLIILLSAMQLNSLSASLVVLSTTNFPNLNTQLQPSTIAENWQELQRFFQQEIKVAQQTSVSVSVKDFGAVGDGNANDTQAIQQAINAVSQAGGGVVFFPTGTYKVNISSTDPELQAIKIRRNVTLQGAGNESSTIKLADGQGNYVAILGGERPDSNVSNFAMYDLGIDGNGSNNPVGAESDFNGGKGRFAVRIFVGSRINIERCRFSNQNSSQTISATFTTANEEVVSDILIKDNIFESIGGGSVDYDHSTIYASGKRFQILNNSFSSKDGPGTKGARTAIETHGDDFVVQGNQIRGFNNGINVTGVARSSIKQIISDNEIKDAYTGITIWSYFFNGNTNNPALNDCTITNNTIFLNINGWRELSGLGPSIGILLFSRSNAPIKGLKIVSNQIFFTNYFGTSGGGDSFASGISLIRDNTNIRDEEISILSNTIENSLAAGIHLSLFVKQGEIAENTIINPGQSNLNFDDKYRAGILAEGSFEDFTINNNLMVDNQNNNRVARSLIWDGNCVNNCELKENYLQVNSSGNSEIFPL